MQWTEEEKKPVLGNQYNKYKQDAENLVQQRKEEKGTLYYSQKCIKKAGT